MRIYVNVQSAYYLLRVLAHFLPVCLKSGSELSRSQSDERFMIIFMNHIKIYLLVRRSRPGLMVRRNFLQRLLLEKILCNLIPSYLS